MAPNVLQLGRLVKLGMEQQLLINKFLWVKQHAKAHDVVLDRRTTLAEMPVDQGVRSSITALQLDNVAGQCGQVFGFLRRQLSIKNVENIHSIDSFAPWDLQPSKAFGHKGKNIRDMAQSLPAVL